MRAKLPEHTWQHHYLMNRNDYYRYFNTFSNTLTKVFKKPFYFIIDNSLFLSAPIISRIFFTNVLNTDNNSSAIRSFYLLVDCIVISRIITRLHIAFTTNELDPFILNLIELGLLQNNERRELIKSIIVLTLAIITSSNGNFDKHTVGLVSSILLSFTFGIFMNKIHNIIDEMHLQNPGRSKAMLTLSSIPVLLVLISIIPGVLNINDDSDNPYYDFFNGAFKHIASFLIFGIIFSAIENKKYNISNLALQSANAWENLVRRINIPNIIKHGYAKMIITINKLKIFKSHTT